MTTELVMVETSDFQRELDLLVTAYFVNKGIEEMCRVTIQRFGCEKGDRYRIMVDGRFFAEFCTWDVTPEKSLKMLVAEKMRLGNV
jgi:hypothetical protein